MRSTFKVISAGTLLLIATALLALRGAGSPADLVKAQVLRQADTLCLLVQQLQAAPTQDRFRKVRLAYKRLEWATEYFDPLTARQVNGPPVPEAELTGLVIQPNGLQVIETLLYPKLHQKDAAALKALLNSLAENALEFKSYFTKATLLDWQILDAAKQEVFRVEILGLNNFDAPLLKNCFKESAAALQSTQAALRLYDPRIDLGAAIRRLQKPNSFDQFDRASFITQYADPVSRAITKLHFKMALPDVRYNRLLNQDAATLFEAQAFNRNAFTLAPGDSATTLKIALGKKLFFDPILSGAMNRSCGSCHQPEKAFTDGLVKNLDITGKKMIARNTPTLINAALQPAQFYDLRAASLEDQANDVVQNADEMHGDMKITTGRLWRNTAYKAAFTAAFPQRKRMAIDTFEVMNALASYIRSLTALNSRFDRYMRGENKAMTLTEVKGFNLFMGKAKCSTCHYLPLFNGALPPRYMQMEAEVIGVPQKLNGKVVDRDPGTAGIQPLGFNAHAFKITTVRNAALTAPYMHNGVFRTLEEVIDFYDKGGGAGTGAAVSNQTLDAAGLHLTVTEKRELIAFIKSLNSTLD